jgi:Tfp pilus assembly protein PilN
MIDRLLTYLKFGNRFCGVEHTTRNGEDHVYITTLKRSKKELLVDDFFDDNSIESSASKLPKNQHIHLVLNNNRVLTKAIESEQQDSLKLVYKAFPNINLDEFYFEVLSQESNHFIALCRKDYVDDIIKKYSELKLSVIDVSLGNTLVCNISGFIESESIYSSNAKITIEENSVTQIEKTDTPSQSYGINGLNIKSEQLLSFSGALQTYLNTDGTLGNLSERKSTLKEDFKQTRFFNLFLKTGGLFILGLLLINFFLFNHYFNRVGDLRQLSQVNQSTKNSVLKLDEMVSKKQKMVDDLLKSSGSKSSYYANEIILSLPNSILLNSFGYQPLLKRIKENKDIELKENTVVIEGASNDSEAFSNWISNLESKDWISKVDILDYGSTSLKSSGFKIEIDIVDD